MKQFRYYHQIEQSDCGLCCRRMVSSWFGRDISAKQIRSYADISREGMSILALKQCAESIGFKTWGIRLKPDLLNDAPLPIILFWNNNHFAVLWKIKKTFSILPIQQREC